MQAIYQSLLFKIKLFTLARNPTKITEGAGNKHVPQSEPTARGQLLCASHGSPAIQSRRRKRVSSGRMCRWWNRRRSWKRRCPAFDDPTAATGSVGCTKRPSSVESSTRRTRSSLWISRARIRRRRRCDWSCRRCRRRCRSPRWGCNRWIGRHLGVRRIFDCCEQAFSEKSNSRFWRQCGKASSVIAPRISRWYMVSCTNGQGRTEVRWRPEQETSLEPPWSNLRSFGSKCAVLEKVLTIVLGLFGARSIVPPFPLGKPLLTVFQNAIRPLPLLPDPFRCLNPQYAKNFLIAPNARVWDRSVTFSECEWS